MRVSRKENADIFEAASVSLGMLAVVTEVCVQIATDMPAFSWDNQLRSFYLFIYLFIKQEDKGPRVALET